MPPFSKFCFRLFCLGGIFSAMVVFLSSCVSVGPKSKDVPGTYIFEVTPVERGQSVQLSGGPIVSVGVPRAAAGYDTGRMAYMRETGKLEYFSVHRWADTPARMLQPLLVNALEGTGSFQAVVMAPSSIKGDVRLDTELVRLRQIFLSADRSQVQLTLRFQLIAGGKVLGTYLFERSMETSSPTPQGGAATVNRLLEEFLAEATLFTKQTVLESNQ